MYPCNYQIGEFWSSLPVALFFNQNGRCILTLMMSVSSLTTDTVGSGLSYVRLRWAVTVRYDATLLIGIGDPTRW